MGWLGRLFGLAAALVAASLVCGCFGGGDCHDRLVYRSIDLTKYCIDSGECGYDGQQATCHINTASDCQNKCAGAGDPSQQDACVQGCVGTVDSCPFTETPSGDQMSWDYPIARLGSAADGLTVFDMSVAAGAPLSGSELRVEVGGKVVCSRTIPDGASDDEIACPLPPKTSVVTFEVLGTHPTFLLYASLREPTPTQHRKVCPM